jgi:hypothetical protein
MFPVRYELGLYIPEYGILQSHCSENPKSYKFIFTFDLTELRSTIERGANGSWYQ